MSTTAESFGQMYEQRVHRLTFNSKPIITSLTIIADENKHLYAPTVVAVILHHAFSLPHDHPSRLPILYLVDSIIKNIGEPYLSLFIAELPALFNSTFGASNDDRVRNSLIKLLNTWRSIGIQPHIIQSMDSFIRSVPRNSVVTLPNPHVVEINRHPKRVMQELYPSNPIQYVQQPIKVNYLIYLIKYINICLLNFEQFHLLLPLTNLIFFLLAPSTSRACRYTVFFCISNWTSRKLFWRCLSCPCSPTSTS